MKNKTLIFSTLITLILFSLVYYSGFKLPNFKNNNHSKDWRIVGGIPFTEKMKEPINTNLKKHMPLKKKKQINMK